MFQRNALKFAYLLECEYPSLCQHRSHRPGQLIEEGEKILYVFSYSKIIPEFEVFLHEDSTKHKPLISEEWWETLFLVKASTKTYGKVLHDTEW